MIMVFAMAAPYAVAVEQSDEEEMQTITSGYEVYSEDENGNLTLIEEESFSEEAPIPNSKSRLTTIPIYHSKSFTGAALTLRAQFSYSGDSVFCFSNQGTYETYNGWVYITGYCEQTKDNFDKWARETYTVKVENQYTMAKQTYKVWIECTRSGAVTKGPY